MADLQAYSCDTITGRKLDQIPMSAFPYSRMLSGGDSGSSVTIPIDGTFSKAELRALQAEWSRLIVLERSGVVEYMGYSQGAGYTRGSSSITVGLVDWWALSARRGAWDHTAPNVEQWKETVAGNLAHQAARAIVRGRTGPAAPPMGFPMTVPGFSGGTSVSRTYYGYHVETVGDVLADLLAEGLDIYFRPRWVSNGEADWLLEAGIGWGTGIVREFNVTAEKSEVMEFSAATDSSRVTNNARYVGEGSEVDMLVRSDRNVSSPYPLLDRVTQAKNVSSVTQLSAMAVQDLSTYGAPTSQWSFAVTADTPIDVGDTARLHFYDDPWIPNGWYNRRVVGIKGDLSEKKTVIVQPTGGA